MRWTLSFLQVAYYGSPIDAPKLFLQAYQVAKLQGQAPILDHTKNPADIIMDMLGNEAHRQAIMNYYKMKFELKAVKQAIRVAKRDASSESIDKEYVLRCRRFSFLHVADLARAFCCSNRKANSGWLNRILVLETRASLRIATLQSLYLPGIFLLFAVVAGINACDHCMSPCLARHFAAFCQVWLTFKQTLWCS